MNRRGQVLIVVLVGGVVCVALWACVRGMALSALSVGEVTAVVEGDRPGTVVVETVREDRAAAWRVDDTGEVVEWLEGDGGGSGTPQSQHCQGDVCYRVAGDALRVEQSRDGGATFTPAWEVGGASYIGLSGEYPDLGDPALHLSSRSLVVHAVPGGHVIFVANGRDGLLFRDVHGDWQRRGVPDSGEGCCFYDPPARIGGSALTVLAVTVGAATATAILLTGLVTAARRRHWRELPVVAALAVAGGVGAGLVAPLADVGMFPGWMYSVPAVLAIAAGGCLLVRWLTTTALAPARGSAPSGEVPHRTGAQDDDA
ncbi:hypothetical protein [Dactylosporangium sp. NPDC005555]|uniref:hypothetical protein n=1 Tax=Dactylosporangium sp. NPDC005555 TaxID=3154889 RepID=UPI0033A4F6C6